MIKKLHLSRSEILALRRFRSDNDGRIIKGVLERALDISRLENENSEANETHRLQVKVVKDVISALYDAELLTEADNANQA